MVRQRWSIGAALALVAAIGCGDGPCGGSEDRAVPLNELPCSMAGASGVWESHPLPPIDDEECYWLEFRACSTYRFENPFAEAPKDVTGYISFERDGRFATPGSGNSFVIQEVTDSEVVIRNAQNQLFWLRLVLQ
jgi:hypothetical protein